MQSSPLLKGLQFKTLIVLQRRLTVVVKGGWGSLSAVQGLHETRATLPNISLRSVLRYLELLLFFFVCVCVLKLLMMIRSTSARINS